MKSGGAQTQQKIKVQEGKNFTEKIKRLKTKQWQKKSFRQTGDLQSCRNLETKLEMLQEINKEHKEY